MKTNSVIVSAVRTPVGKKGGYLKNFDKAKLAGLAMKESLKKINFSGEEIDDVMYGGIGAIEYRGPARHFWLEAGLPIQVPGLTINRACSTSLTGVALAAANICAGFGNTYMVGGVEMDSKTTYSLVNDNPYKGGMPYLSRGFFSPAQFGNEPMYQTAENVAARYGITREECDQYAVRSHRLASMGYESGLYQNHVMSIEIKNSNGTTFNFDRDEILRPDTNMEALKKLKPVCNGVVTAGNSSPLNDGASAAIVINEDKARSLGLKPIMRFVDYVAVGVDPHYMGLGPIDAMKKLLLRNKMSFNDIDFIECNEAFAAQTIAVVNELGLDINKVNMFGGAIALGHPGSATGVSLVAKSGDIMKKIGAERCIITFCNGGGQGVAALFENCD